MSGSCRYCTYLEVNLTTRKMKCGFLKMELPDTLEQPQICIEQDAQDLETMRLD